MKMNKLLLFFAVSMFFSSFAFAGKMFYYKDANGGKYKICKDKGGYVVYKPSGNTLTPAFRITVSTIIDTSLVPQCSVHKNDRMNKSFSLLVILYFSFLPYV